MGEFLFQCLQKMITLILARGVAQVLVGLFTLAMPTSVHVGLSCGSLEHSLTVAQ
jgi:hypothetical protein